MFQTLAYYATVFHRSFTAYTSRHLQALGLNFGSLFPVIYVGKHPGCTQAQLTAALGRSAGSWTGWWRRAFSPGRSPAVPTIWI